MALTDQVDGTERDDRVEYVRRGLEDISMAETSQIIGRLGLWGRQFTGIVP